MFKVMLVEDNRTFRQTVRESLQNQVPSMAVTEAGNEMEALEKVGSFVPHLIFMDIQLLEENGLKLVERIKKIHPEIVIAILTNHDTPEYREAATRCKADYFCHKISTSTAQIHELIGSVWKREQ